MFCPKCGSRIPEGGSFCAACGNKMPTDVMLDSIPVSAPAMPQEKMPWRTLFRAEWRNQIHKILFIVYAVLMSFVLVTRVSIFNIVGDCLDYFENMLSNANLEEESGVMSMFVLSGRGLNIANFAYCILMAVGIWWSFAQSREQEDKLINGKPYTLMILAQIVMIIGYVLAFLAMFFLRITFVSALGDHTGKSYDAMHEAMVEPIDKTLIFLAGTSTYHIIGSLMLRRVRYCAEYELPFVSSLATTMAVASFVVAGIMLIYPNIVEDLLGRVFGTKIINSSIVDGYFNDEKGILQYSVFLTMAFHAVGGVMLILFRQRQGSLSKKHAEYKATQTVRKLFN